LNISETDVRGVKAYCSIVYRIMCLDNSQWLEVAIHQHRNYGVGMKLSKLFRASLGRAIIAVFAAQVVAGAMCLMPAAAMAGPQTSGMPATNVCAMDHAASSSHARHACPHCDAPVQAVSQIDMTHGIQAPALLPVVLSVLPTPPVVAVRPAVMPVPRILAPPDSRYLILRNTLRIRI